MVATSDVPALTVMIATNDGWEMLRKAYLPIRAQAEGKDIEILLLDGSGNTRPPADELGSTTRWIEMPGSEVAEMRVHGYRVARGRVIAMTEDHVVAADDWMESILRAHHENPGAAAIGGAVRNGSSARVIDWASFYAGHGPYMKPLPRGEVPYLSGINIAYKRDQLLEALDALGDGAVEVLINEQIKAAGGHLHADDRLMVTHYQSPGVADTARLHFYAGRSFEGARRGERAPRMAQVVRAICLPIPRSAKRLLAVLRKGQPIRRVMSAAPAMLFLTYSQAAGELVGMFRGPGRTPPWLH